jgi:single-stranded-DNA-specific exonuclease
VNLETLTLLLTPKRWYVAARAPDDVLNCFPDMPRVIKQVLYNRNIVEPDQVRAFLDHRPAGDTDPFQLKGMSAAVARLRQAIDAGELIAVYGDYDADGVTATALMTYTLTALGGHACHYIPDRFDEGYGLRIDALTKLAGDGVRVVLTVDCGIRSVAEVVHSNRQGMDVIVTDHHSPADELPPALATINPKQVDCHYPFKQLAGVGLAFKLAQALMQHTESRSSLAEDDLLDLVALGTVADIAPLLDENRALVTRGLEHLNSPRRIGLQALMAQAGVQPGKIGAETIGFVLGPRLNAAGRLESALAAYELLLTNDLSRAGQLAQQLGSQNTERQAQTRIFVEEARQAILKAGGSRALYFIARPSFNRGVVGLVAGRLTEEFYRPILVAEHGEQETIGSARSIPEFHITRALDECIDLLERHGGHSAAAGFTVKNENLAALEAKLLAIAERELAGKELVPALEIDYEAELRGIDRRRTEDLLTARAAGRPLDEKEKEQGLQIMDGLDQLRPFGAGNPAPVFSSRGLEIKGKRVIGSNGEHLKLVLYDGRQTWDAIAFRQGAWHDYLPARADVAYTLEINEWNGRSKLQLNVKDIKPAEEVG